jgi:predicted nucleotidyltransferase
VATLSERRAQTKERLQLLRQEVKAVESLAVGKACVYATGSFGRCEASEHSDLDVFIVGKSDGKAGIGGKQGSLLKRLDEICVKAELIKITRKLKIPDFSGDGQYLDHYSAHELTKSLGTPEDDAINTFTARLLLLLESHPILEDQVYKEITKEVINAYWRDYEDHQDEFMPAFLANDILRLWRTFCVNYEARTERVPEEQKAKGKLKNYKLKHSRMLTCYSALLYLLAVHSRDNTVSPADTELMISMTPTERLEWLSTQSHISSAHQTIAAILRQYDHFLETTNAKESELISRFSDREASRKYLTAAYQFGDSVFEALSAIGNASRFYRLLIV